MEEQINPDEGKTKEDSSVEKPKRYRLKIFLYFFLGLIVLSITFYTGMLFEARFIAIQKPLVEVPTPTLSPLDENQVTANVPPISGGNLLISVVDKQGQAVRDGIVNVLVEYQDFPDRNYRYPVKLVSIQDGLLPLYPPPSHILATVSIWVATSDRGKSDTLVIKNDEYWKTVELTVDDYVARHEFNLGRSNQVTNIFYN